MSRITLEQLGKRRPGKRSHRFRVIRRLMARDDIEQSGWPSAARALRERDRLRKVLAGFRDPIFVWDGQRKTEIDWCENECGRGAPAGKLCGGCAASKRGAA